MLRTSWTQRIAMGSQGLCQLQVHYEIMLGNVGFLAERLQPVGITIAYLALWQDQVQRLHGSSIADLLEAHGRRRQVD